MSPKDLSDATKAIAKEAFEEAAFQDVDCIVFGIDAEGGFRCLYTSMNINKLIGTLTRAAMLIEQRHDAEEQCFQHEPRSIAVSGAGGGGAVPQEN